MNADERAALLDALPPRQREIIRLRLVVGLSAQETADRLGMAPSAVRMAQHRALDRLRRQLPVRDEPGTTA
ncbi:sigma-70 family RNA polymerase sigma factor [Actinophytocola gossypii]|uniref:Sigma-70 family RNA polymerase sigma factor n=1 Tax=Actinophytocola gossypii TaxID=2812003 RepID=A0ABT2JIK9_9PSEU|nr:sigma-70 family RNA polymerase sigma factor [Actinophytocola gossypii]